MTFKSITSALGLCALALVSTACGKTETFVKDWTITNTGTHFNVTAAFNPTYELDGEAKILLKKYGTVTLGQNDARQFTISLDLEHAVFNEPELDLVSALPTGEAFPSIVPGPLGVLRLQEQPGKWLIKGYFGRPTTSEGVKKAIAGLGIQLEGVDSSFPVLSLTQNYFNGDNQRFGSLTIYGPKLDAQGRVLVPGGLLLVADLNVLLAKSKGKGLKKIEFQISQDFEVTGPDARRYKSKKAKQLLALKFLQEAERSGVIRRR